MGKVEQIIETLTTAELASLHGLSEDEKNDAAAWELSGRALSFNPIVKAFMDHTVDVINGENDPEEGLSTIQDVVERWQWYMAEGEQEVSWYLPIMTQATDYFMALGDALRGSE